MIQNQVMNLPTVDVVANTSEEIIGQRVIKDIVMTAHKN